MNSAIFKVSNSNDINSSFRAALFHSTPPLQRKRRNHWDSVISDRLALGLSVSGPLKLEDVKNAYRPCALKWHPDRHQGSSKAVAEEKFELCSAAYQSLCDSLALD
ncbi:Chaperone protein DnaJ [Glycine soja]|nr:Chaperone protein DnaJ [Glycine soja]